MISTISAASPEFEPAAARAVGMLGTMSAHLERMWDSIEDPIDQTDFLHLSSMTQLAGCRGWHFISDDAPVDVTFDSVEDVATELAHTHHLLVESVTGLDTFEVLQFVDEVGALCREMRRYAERH